MKDSFFKDAAGKKSSQKLQMFLTLLFTFLVLGYQTYEQGTFNIMDAVVLFTASFLPKSIRDLKELTNKK